MSDRQWQAAAPRSAGSRAVQATVTGLVQGVGFRWFVSREAHALGLTGWVANQADGSVAVTAEGEAAAVEAFLEALREGPPGADVATVAVLEMRPSGAYRRFEIRSGAHRGD